MQKYDIYIFIEFTKYKYLYCFAITCTYYKIFQINFYLNKLFINYKKYKFNLTVSFIILMYLNYFYIFKDYN